MDLNECDWLILARLVYASLVSALVEVGLQTWANTCIYSPKFELVLIRLHIVMSEREWIP